MLLHYKCTSAVLMSAMLHRAAHVLNTCRNQIPKETVHWTGACRVCAPNIAHYLLLRKKLKCIVTVIGSFNYLSESGFLVLIELLLWLFSTVCRVCIMEKINDEDVDCCPVCNIDLGCDPEEKLRWTSRSKFWVSSVNKCFSLLSSGNAFYFLIIV